METKSFEFVHNYRYDSFGRIQHIIYPDGDKANYSYYNSGQLSSVSHLYQGTTYSLIDSLKYDEADLTRRIMADTKASEKSVRRAFAKMEKVLTFKKNAHELHVRGIFRGDFYKLSFKSFGEFL